KQFSFPDALTIYSNINYAKVDEAKVMCEYGDNFVWYALIDNDENKGLMIVGDKKGPKDSFAFPESLKIENYSCDIIEGVYKGYAIENYSSKVFTNGMIFRNFVIFRNNNRTRYLLATNRLSGERIIKVVIGKETKEYNGALWFVFSPDNKRVGFVGQKGDKWVAIVDGKEISKEYDGIGWLLFSPDSKRVAFMGREGTKHVVVIDGKESKVYDLIHTLIFSPDSKRLGFMAQKGTKHVVVINDKESKEYDDVSWLSFSPDSKRVGFMAQKGAKYVAVIDGRDTKEYDYVFNIYFSSNSKSVGFVAKKGTKYVAVVDGKESNEYNSIVDNEIKFINGSKYAVFIGTKEVSKEDKVESKSYLVVNNREIMSFKNLTTLIEVDKGFKFLAHIGNKLYSVSCK
ncbi:MAG: TolB family protein, partial [Planctomycetota bacterium]